MGKATAMKTNNERIAEWLGWVQVDGELWNGPSGEIETLPWFDTHVAPWYVREGLFIRIKERGLWGAFLTQLLKDMDVFVATEDDGSEWIETRHIYDLLTVGPSQLTVTLLVVIDAEAEKDD